MSDRPLVPRYHQLTRALEQAREKPLTIGKRSLKQPVDKQASIISSRNRRKQRPITLAGQKPEATGNVATTEDDHD